MRIHLIASCTLLTLLAAAPGQAKTRRKAAAPAKPTVATATPAEPAPILRAESPLVAPAARPSVFGEPERHDGLFLRAMTGTNYTSLSKIEKAQLGLVIDLQGGYSVAENLNLFAEFRISNGMRGVGVGAVYYFMPLNLYAGGSLMLAWSAVPTLFDGEVSSSLGPTVNLQVGKEWWVSDSVGMGVAAQLLVGALTFDQLIEEQRSMTLVAFSLAAVATFN
jgi:hypothetical protein